MPSPTALTPATESFLLTAAATSGLCLGLTLYLLQTDSVSRRCLSPERLRLRRRLETLYRVDRGIERNARKEREAVRDPSTPQYDETYEKERIEFVHSPREIQEFISAILPGNKATEEGLSPRIVAVELDEEDQRDTKEYFIFLAIPVEEKKWRQVQIPLVAFATGLAEAFERCVTSTTFCFVTDVSSGLATDVLGRVLTDCEYGVATVTEPSWMIALARIAEKRLISKEKMERILFALCRLEAHRLRDHVGDSRTVVIFLPGQSFIPSLLPILQKAFPCERHVFAYDTATNALRRALVPSSRHLLTSSPLSPLSSLPQSSFATRLKSLPALWADTVEAWMGAVNTFLELKNEEKRNEYLPFVARMGFLMGETNTLGNGDVDQGELALTNLLQFITGSRSRPLPPDVMTRARRSLHQCRLDDKRLFQKTPPLTTAEKLKVEDCVFLHKGILIGSKTLMDTVQPAPEWTLKAAMKISGCSCCAPEEEEDDEEEEETKGTDRSNGTSVDLSVPGAGFAMNGGMGLTKRNVTAATPEGGTSSRPKYVDGKVGFAFDPTAFSR